MNGRVDVVDLQELRYLIFYRFADELSDEMKIAIMEFAEKSNPICAGMYGTELVCIFGFVVPMLLSDTAYLWLYTTAALERHKIKFGRHAARYIKSMHNIYPRIVGHCAEGSNRSIEWLLRLGAKFDQPSKGLVPFIIGDTNG